MRGHDSKDTVIISDTNDADYLEFSLEEKTNVPISTNTLVRDFEFIPISHLMIMPTNLINPSL